MVYFIKHQEYIKIGYTNNPNKRISAIQTSLPEKLDVLLIIDGGIVLERELHCRFANYSTSGEWFRFEQEIAVFIADNYQRDRRYEFGFIGSDFLGNEQILRMRQSSGLKLRQVAKLLGVSVNSAKAMENREKDKTIGLQQMERIAKIYGKKFEYRFR